MTTVTKPVCQLCNGKSWTREIVGDEVQHYRCRCFKLRQLTAYLGPELAKAPHRRSELYNVEIDPETGEEIGDRTLDDLFIQGTWSEVSQHIRWAVGAKNFADPSFTFRLVQDEMLLRVYVGDFAYYRRSTKVRDDIETFNGIRDLVGPCSLLIVRLGGLSHPNKAAANVLSEVLRVRASGGKPTWLVEDTQPFENGHLFYSYDVDQFIDDNFETINVGGDVEAARKQEEELRAVSAESVSFEPVETPVVPRVRERAGEWEGKKKSPSKWGKRKGGGGLIQGL